MLAVDIQTQHKTAEGAAGYKDLGRKSVVALRLSSSCLEIARKTVCIHCSHWQESRSRENLEKKWLIFFSLELENCIFISLSLLDFQDFETKILFLFSICEIFKTILFLFSIFKIVQTKFSFYSRFMRFCSLFLFLFLWEMLHILERNMHLSGFEVWCQKRITDNQNLNPFFKSKMFGKISLSPLKNYELFISLSLLKIGEQH